MLNQWFLVYLQGYEDPSLMNSGSFPSSPNETPMPISRPSQPSLP